MDERQSLQKQSSVLYHPNISQYEMPINNWVMAWRTCVRCLPPELDGALHLGIPLLPGGSYGTHSILHLAWQWQLYAETGEEL